MSDLGVQLGKLREVEPRDLAIRFVAGGATSLVAALIGVFVSARASGPMLAFPAIYLAGLTLVERKEGEDKAHAVAIGAVAGAVGLAAYAVAADFLSRALAWPLVLPAAVGAWIAVTAVLYTLGRALVRVRPEGAE